MNAKFSIGIDLGTTNSVLAYTPLDVEEPHIELLPIPQLVAASTVENRPMLPSFLYISTEEEAQAGSCDLPWAAGNHFAVGAYARAQAADVPRRTVAAAKSWLCHSRVDRRKEILPWNAPEDVAKVSPVTATQRYLAHMAAAWHDAFPEAPIGEQKVTLTVPASFDASARELTREAAVAAGLPEDIILLEEPQSALYAWLAAAGRQWRKQLKVDDTLLVCDIGGGTTDFTLISVAEENGELQLTRRAVGNHILVGGDNMDLALAHTAKGKFGDQQVDIDPWQAVGLWHSCRTAKELLLGPEPLEAAPITVLGRSSKVIGGTVTTELSRNEVSDILLDGFFPLCELGEHPKRRMASGFKEIGLPFESDVAITKHLSHFLSLHHGDGESAARPTHIIFNGGVMKATALQQRMMEVFEHWFGDGQVPDILEGSQDLDFAVARGAAYYGHAKDTGGIRIRGGTARAYYVGIETLGLAVPGAERPLHALCVVPHGMEEGTSIEVPGNEIGLAVGEEAHFRFFNSAVRKDDQPGVILEHWNEGELVETDSLEMILEAADEANDGYVPVKFETCITELGVLELWCVSAISGDRWKLEFSVRDEREG
ncbi:MAG: Hsp70 family protein [Spartobacteria bacterium]|nr:Hsp70 family protein [Spartobacteria bacterium]